MRRAVPLASIVLAVACGNRGDDGARARGLPEPPCPTPPKPCPGVPAVVDTLRDPTQRGNALVTLYAQMRPRRVARALGAALDCEDKPLRLGVLGAIEREGTQLDAALPGVARRINDPDRDVADAALAALEKMAIAGDTPSGDATKALIERLGHLVAAPERKRVIWTLAWLHPTVDAYPALAQVLLDPDVEMRAAAINALHSMADRGASGLPPSAVDTLIEATKDGDPYIYREAMLTLGRLRDPRAVKFLSDALDDPTADHAIVASALAEAGPSARGAESRLAAIVAGDDEPMAVREAATWALGEIGADSERAMVALAIALLLPPEYLIEQQTSDGRGKVRQTAEWVLKTLAAKHSSKRRVARVLLAYMGTNEDALEVLCEKDPEVELIAPKLVALSHHGESMGHSIAYCLGDRGGLAKGARPDLVKQTREADPYLRTAAATGLGAIRSQSAVAALVAQLARLRRSAGRDDEREATAALRALTKIGAKVDRAAIAVWLDRPCWGAAAAVTLVATGTDVRAGTQRLDELLDSPMSGERFCAVTELAEIIGDKRVAAQRAKLGALIVDPESMVREAAAIAVSKLGPAAEPFLPALIAALPKLDNYKERQAVSDAFVAMGGAALPAFPEIVRAVVADGGHDPRLWSALTSIIRTNPETAERLRAALADEGYLLRRLGEIAIESAKAAP